MGCTGSAGTAANKMRGPRDLKFDKYGNIYVTDQGNNRIQKYMIQLPTSPCPPTSKNVNHLIELFFVFKAEVSSNS